MSESNTFFISGTDPAMSRLPKELFAVAAAYCGDKGDYLRQQAGDFGFKTTFKTVGHFFGAVVTCRNGLEHSFHDQPAVIYDDGTKEWRSNGVRHRDGDLPAVILSTGSKQWFRNGVLHRDGGPAIIYYNGEEQWFCNGQWRRTMVLKRSLQP